MSYTDLYITDDGQISGIPPKHFLEELARWKAIIEKHTIDSDIWIDDIAEFVDSASEDGKQ